MNGIIGGNTVLADPILVGGGKGFDPGMGGGSTGTGTSTGGGTSTSTGKKGGTSTGGNSDACPCREVKVKSTYFLSPTPVPGGTPVIVEESKIVCDEPPGKKVKVLCEESNTMNGASGSGNSSAIVNSDGGTSFPGGYDANGNRTNIIGMSGLSNDTSEDVTYDTVESPEKVTCYNGEVDVEINRGKQAAVLGATLLGAIGIALLSAKLNKE